MFGTPLCDPAGQQNTVLSYSLTPFQGTVLSAGSSILLRLTRDLSITKGRAGNCVCKAPDLGIIFLFFPSYCLFPILSLYIPSAPSKFPFQSLLPNLCISKLSPRSRSKHFDLLSDFSQLVLSSVSNEKPLPVICVSYLSLWVISPLGAMSPCFSYSVEFLLTVDNTLQNVFLLVTEEGGNSIHSPTAIPILVQDTSLHF